MGLRDGAPGAVPMPDNLRPDAFYTDGLSAAEIAAVVERFRAKHAEELRIPRAWRPALNSAVMDAKKARRSGTLQAKPVEPIEPVQAEPTAIKPEPAEVDVHEAVAEAVEPVEVEAQAEPEPKPDPVQEAVEPEPEGVEVEKARKPRAKADRPKRLTSFEFSDRAAWLTAVNLHRGMPIAGMRLAAVLGLVHRSTMGISWYGQARLAKMTGSPRSTVQAGIDALCAAGFLGRERVWRDGKQGSNRYAIQMPAEVARCRDTRAFLASLGPDFDAGDDRDSGHPDEGRCPNFRSSDDRDSGLSMTEIPGTNETKEQIELNETKRAAAARAGSSIDQKGPAPSAKVPLPDDFEAPAEAVQRLRDAGLSEERITASLDRWRAHNAGKQFPTSEWSRKCGQWLKIERTDTVQGSRMPEDWWPSEKAIDQLASRSGLKCQDVERLTAAFYHERRGATGWKAESADWIDTWAAEILKAGGRRRQMAI